MDHVLVLLRDIGEHLEALGSLYGSVLQHGASQLLQRVLLVRKVELPLVEGVTEVSPLVLLPVCHEVEPVLDDLAHLEPAAPPVEHLGLQVVVCPVPALPPTDGLREQLLGLHIRLVGDLLDFVVFKAFRGQEVPQIRHSEALV